MSNSSVGLQNKLCTAEGVDPECLPSMEVLESIPDGILILDSTRSQAVAINTAFGDMIGAPPENTAAVFTQHPLELIHADDHARFLDLGDPGHPEAQAGVDLRVQSGSGNWLSVEVFARHLTPAESSDHWFYFFRRLEGRRMLEEKLDVRIREQKDRTVEAVKASLRIYQLTEKLRLSPKLSTLLLEAKSEDDLFKRAGEFLRSEGLNCHQVCIFTIDNDELCLRFSTEDRARRTYPLGQEHRYSKFLEEGCQSMRSRNHRLLVLRGQQGVLGLLEVKLDPREGILFSENKLIEEWHDDILDTIAEILGLSIDNIRLYQELRRQTVLDPLTGIYNRHFLLNELESEICKARRFERTLAVIFADVDGFKEVNDTLGHHQGDFVLKEVAGILKESFRDSDCACRYGGDEFVVLLPETGLEAAEAKAQELCAAVGAHRFPVLDQYPDLEPLRLTISAGVAATHGNVSADQILQAADLALYGAKRKGKNCVFQIGESLAVPKPSKSRRSGMKLRFESADEDE